MAIENLPRPWLLAALTGLKIAELVSPGGDEGVERRPQGVARPEPRRRRRRAVTQEDRPGQGKDAWLN